MPAVSMQVMRLDMNTYSHTKHALYQYAFTDFLFQPLNNEGAELKLLN